MILLYSINFIIIGSIIISTNAYIIGRLPNDLPMPEECRILNHEKMMEDDSVPREIVINGIPYQVYGQIQHGATSRVFHAVERQAPDGLPGCRAVKVVDMERIEHHKQNQLMNEAKILQELNAKQMERIPMLYTMEHIPSKKSMSMVFELAHHDLFDEITPRMGQGEHKWVRNTFRDILQAIQPVHENDIVHGDIKPENMAYFKNNAIKSSSPNDNLVLKVIDFGGAMKADQLDNACSDIVTGTILYMSPEQVAWCASRDNAEFVEKRKAHKLSKKSDVWSVGIILYQLLYGHSPYAQFMDQFEAPENSEERAERLDSALRPAILHGTEPIEFGDYQDKPILEMLKKCLHRHPEKRPSIAELLESLEKLDEDIGQLKNNVKTAIELVKEGQQQNDGQAFLEQMVGQKGGYYVEKMPTLVEIVKNGGENRVNIKDILMMR